MFVKKMARPEQNRLGKIFLKENENVFESTQCLATGDGCVNYQEDISKLLKISISSIKLDTTFVISAAVKEARDNEINELIKGKEDTWKKKGARKTLVGLGCIAWVGVGTTIFAAGGAFGGPVGAVVAAGYALEKTSRHCSSWWKRADYRW